MKITVAICTWNRAALLAQTLEQMCALEFDADLDWELLVVNNNCTDDTDEVLTRFAGRLPLRRLFEPRPGLSHARNCAIQSATGEYLVWTDDDVLVVSDWLRQYSVAMRDSPRVAFFGGPIEAWFEVDPPAWLIEAWPLVSGAFAMRDLGDQPIPFCDSILPFGANYAVRTEFQREYRYDPALGRKAGNFVGSEETTLLMHMLGDGYEGRWVPQARVRHFIPKERLTSAYLRNYFFGYGEGDVIRWRAEDPQKLALKRRWLRIRAWRAELRYQVRSRLCGPEAWVEDLIVAARYRGRLAQLAKPEPLCAVAAE